MMMQRRSRVDRRRAAVGFTLVEVLLVLLILGVLAGVLVVSLSGTRERARVDTTKLLISAVESQLERYNMDLGHYPSEEEGALNALVTKPTFEDEAAGQKWGGPYRPAAAIDAWNRPLRYELNDASATGEGQKPFKLWSLGADGQDGTEDDIRNWSEATGS